MTCWSTILSPGLKLVLCHFCLHSNGQTKSCDLVQYQWNGKMYSFRGSLGWGVAFAEHHGIYHTAFLLLINSYIIYNRCNGMLLWPNKSLHLEKISNYIFTKNTFIFISLCWYLEQIFCFSWNHVHQDFLTKMYAMYF